MSQAISTPPSDSHVAPCGLFCSNCRKFTRGRCKGCQVEPAFACCPVRGCCIERKIVTCAECPDFKSPRDYKECPKINHQWTIPNDRSNRGGGWRVHGRVRGRLWRNRSMLLSSVRV